MNAKGTAGATLDIDREHIDTSTLGVIVTIPNEEDVYA